MRYDIALTKSAQRKLRLCKIFKTASAIAYDDIFESPWKIPFCIVPSMGIGTMLMIGTLGYYALSQSSKAVTARQDLARVMTQKPRPRVYKRYMTHKNNEWNISTFQMVRYMAQWNYHYLRSKLYIYSSLTPKKLAA